MKYPHTKKKGILGTLLAFLSQLAYAFIWLVIGLLVVVIGIIIVVKLLELIKKINVQPAPGQPATNNVAWSFAVTNVVLADFNSASRVKSAASKGVEGDSWTCMLQYGLSDRPGSNLWNTGWMALGSGRTSSVTNGITTDTIQDDADGYECFTTIAGTTFWQQELAVDYTNGIPGIFVRFLPQTVIIERTTNLSPPYVWIPVYTNRFCGLGTVENFTDTNGPPGGAFYRTHRIGPLIATDPVTEEILWQEE